ncbi:MAG: winged helix-turn-helix domain-containing protein [Candidatus Acidiferrum sp.]|jgi:DNA-binding winged helix-turn-helix (wHTH) protein/tetratricopeptide (TPR) repeat protein
MAGDRFPTGFHFGDYRLDVSALQLRKHGIRVPLRHQASRVLVLLARRSGQLVTREELQRELWGAGTFVDFERGLNNCVKQIREALCDDAERPRYVETIPRRGYRFLPTVEVVDEQNGWAASAGALAGAAVEVPSGITPATPAETSKPLKFKAIWIAAVCVLVVAGFGRWMLVGRPAFSFHERDSILISDFDNHTGDPRFDDALLTAFTVGLEQSRYANVVPRSRVYSALGRMGKPATQRITQEIGREICQREDIRGLIVLDITRTGQQYALTAGLIDPSTGTAVRSYSERVHGEDHVLEALDSIAVSIRADLGESLYQIHRASRSLPQVTTTSLEALKAYADGETLWHASKYNEAATRYRSAIALDPDFAMAHASLGHALCSHIFQYQRDLCAQEYGKALALSSRTSERERRLIQANYAYDLGHVQESDDLYRLYLRDYPDDWQVRRTYARLLRMHDREEEAISQYRELLRATPNEAGVYIDIATAYKTLNKPSDAVREYLEAFRLDPARLNISNVNREYGFALVANGEEAEAVEVFAALCTNLPTRSDCLHSLALLDLLHGRYAKAHERFREALSLAQQYRDPFLVARNHFLLAVVAAGEGQRAAQLKELAAVLSDFENLGPKVEYGSLVGQEFARAGAIEQAEKIGKRIAQLADPDSSEQTGYLRLLQGQIAVAKGEQSQAIDLFELQDPRFGRSVRQLAIEALASAYQKAGDTDEAVSWYEKLLATSPCGLVGWEPQQRCEEARVALAADYLARGDKQKAEAALAPLLTDWKDADSNLPLQHQALELAMASGKPTP